MSSLIVRQALELVDADSSVERRNNKKGRIGKKFKLIKKNSGGEKKVTLSKVRETLTCKEDIYKKNSQKLQFLRGITTITLKETNADNIIERGVTERPVKVNKSKGIESKSTVFTEEDFEKFEECLGEFD